MTIGRKSRRKRISWKKEKERKKNNVGKRNRERKGLSGQKEKDRRKEYEWAERERNKVNRKREI